MDYSLGQGVQFANEYDEDQTGHELTNKVVNLPISDFNKNDWIGLQKTWIVSDYGKEDQ